MKNKKKLIITVSAAALVAVIVLAALFLPGSPFSILPQEDGCAHQYGLYTLSQTPTYKEAATAEHTCTLCGVTETISVYAATGLEYETVEDQTIVVSAKGFTGKVLYIAATKEDGTPVDAIGESVFSETGIEAVYIENGIQCLQDYAFAFNDKLMQVSIPASITEYGSYTFAGNKALTSVTLDKNATKLGVSQFYECSALSSVTLPDGIAEIPMCVFFGCSGLESVVLPKSLTAIGSQAFLGCTSLASVQLPDSLKQLYANAFTGCTSLTSVVLPALDKLSYHAFLGCTSLKTVYLPAAIKEIERNGADGPFYSCSPDLVLYTDAAERPEGWDKHFNSYDSDITDDDGGELNDEAYHHLKVVYGCTLTDYLKKE